MGNTGCDPSGGMEAPCLNQHNGRYKTKTYTLMYLQQSNETEEQRKGTPIGDQSGGDNNHYGNTHLG